MSIFAISNPLLGVLAPLIFYLFLRSVPAFDAVFDSAPFHFQIVSATSLIGLMISIVIGLVGQRKRNLQVIYVALAFISLAALFSVHGLATPGFILEGNALVGVASQLSVLVMAFWLALSTLPTDHPVSAWLSQRARLLVSIWTPLISLAGLYALRNPAIVDWMPVDEAPLRGFVTIITIFLAAAAGFRYWQSYRYSRFPFQLAMAYTDGWVAVSQIIITTGELFYLSWWTYHVLLLAAVIVTVIGLIAQYSRRNSLVLSVRGLFATDPRQRLEAAISPSVRALVAATEARDTYTAGHSYRVALGAVSLGSALDLPPEDLRTLAQGGIVHDIGKLQVPDRILNKPGALTPEERRQIERHPVLGYEMCSRLGFMAEELALIRSHHERLDGSGYPDQLAGERLSPLIRILAIADVYDALTSARAYRSAWSQDDALDYLQQESGIGFDPHYVSVWSQVVRSGAFKPKTGELL